MNDRIYTRSPRRAALAGLAALLVLQPAVAGADFPGLGMYVGDPGGDTSDPELVEKQREFEENYDKFTRILGQEANSFDAFVDFRYPIWDPIAENVQWLNSGRWIADIYAFTCARKGRVDSAGRPTMIPILSIPLADNPSTMPDGNKALYDRHAAINMMTDIANGVYDDLVFIPMLDRFRDNGFKKIYYRIGWEQNGDWYGWQARTPKTAAAYNRAWQHLATLARAYGQANDMAILTVWSPATSAVFIEVDGELEKEAAEDGVMMVGPVTMEDMYPGDEYVDIIAPDVYSPIWHPTKSGTYTQEDPSFHDWTTEQTVSLEQWYANPENRWYAWDYPESHFFSPTRGWGLPAAIDFAVAKGKPFGVSETGAGNNGVHTEHGGGPEDEPEFPKYLAARLKAAMRDRQLKLEFVAIWAINTDENPPGNWGFLDGEKPLQAEAWRQFVIDMGSGVVPGRPAAPSGLSAVASAASRVDLSWTDNASDETNYVVYRSTDGTTFSELTTLASDATSHGDTTVTAGGSWHYRVAARNSAGTSDPSDTVSVTTPQSAPTAPSGLTAAASSSSRINLAWTDNSGNETGFHIERSSGGSSFSRIVTTTANTTSYQDTNRRSRTTYTYRVRATNAVGNSAYSNTASARTR